MSTKRPFGPAEPTTPSDGSPPQEAASPGLRERARQRLGQALFDYGLHGLARLGQLHPHARPHHHAVQVERNVPYLSSSLPEHQLDIYHPTPQPPTDKPHRSARHRVHQPPYPVVLYIHGGSFRILSKDTHWLMALAYARRGMVVFNVNYRLSPQHPFPAALSDVSAALAFAVKHAARYGGDPKNLVIAGESAGANLVTALTLMTCVRRPEPFAQDVFALGFAPKAVVPMCGILQVSDAERFSRRRPLQPWILDRLTEVRDAYLHQSPADATTRELADPLLMLEQPLQLERPLPPFFAGVGTRDPLLDDTRRLERALRHLAVPHQVCYYPGELHAFHALVFRTQARQCWREQHAFLDRYLLPPSDPKSAT